MAPPLRLTTQRLRRPLRLVGVRSRPRFRLEIRLDLLAGEVHLPVAWDVEGVQLPIVSAFEPPRPHMAVGRHHVGERHQIVFVHYVPLLSETNLKGIDKRLTMW